MTLPKIVSLFSGAGGLDHGFHSSGYELVFAADLSSAAIRTHKRNFPKARSVVADLTELKPEGVLRHLSEILQTGESIGIIGGPPCQGFSRANPFSSADDPRNQLPLLYLEVVEALQKIYNVQFVLFENVLGIRDVKHSLNFAAILARFRALGLHDDVQEYCASDYGVPQNRRRVIISAFSSPTARSSFSPTQIDGPARTVRQTIAQLPEPAFFARGLTPDRISHHPNHWTMRPVSKKFSDPDLRRSGSRSFRRLAWDEPSPTVAYGHREIHIHPDGHRRLSIFEAMLLQGFPEDFVLEGTLSAQVEQVSNAVPPPLAKALAEATATALSAGDIDEVTGDERAA